MKSVTVRIHGGLGNQLHCYSFGISISNSLKREVVYDCKSGFNNDVFKRQFLLKYFPNVKLKQSSYSVNFWPKVFNRFHLSFLSFISRYLPFKFKFVVHEVSPWKFNKSLLEHKHIFSPYFIGYWSTHLYYKDIEKRLRFELKPPPPSDQSALKILAHIKKVRSCAIHWRSYIECNISQDDSMESYYKKSIIKMNKFFPDMVYFVFSDEPKLAQKKFSLFLKNFIIIDLACSKSNKGSLNDFFLMYSCQNAIVGNSTFSWWAAWLSDDGKKKIIAPSGLSPWGSDWIPKSWISISVKNNIGEYQ